MCVKQDTNINFDASLSFPLFYPEKQHEAFKFQFLVNHVTTSLGLSMDKPPSSWNSNADWPARTESGRVYLDVASWLAEVGKER